MNEFERQLTSTLSEMAAEVRVAADPWAEHQRRLLAAKSRSSRRVVFAAVAAAVVLVAALVLPGLLTRSRPGQLMVAAGPTLQVTTAPAAGATDVARFIEAGAIWQVSITEGGTTCVDVTAPAGEMKPNAGQFPLCTGGPPLTPAIISAPLTRSGRFLLPGKALYVTTHAVARLDVRDDRGQLLPVLQRASSGGVGIYYVRYGLNAVPFIYVAYDHAGRIIESGALPG